MNRVMLMVVMMVVVMRMRMMRVMMVVEMEVLVRMVRVGMMAEHVMTVRPSSAGGTGGGAARFEEFRPGSSPDAQMQRLRRFQQVHGLKW